MYFEGVDGIKQLYTETLQYRDLHMYGWISAVSLHDDLISWYDTDYRPKRIKQKLYLHTIAADSEAAQFYRQKDESGFHITRIDTTGELDVSSDILLFGTRSVAILSWDDMIGVVIDSEKLYKTLRSMFQM